MSKTKVNVQVPRATLSRLSNRFSGMQATLKCAAAAIEGGDDEAASEASEAVRFIEGELSRLYEDLAIHEWLDCEEARPTGSAD